MKLLPSFEKKTKIENAKQYLLQMIQEIPGCLVSTTQCTNWMADSEGFPDKVNKQKWACEQYVAMAIQQKEFLTQSDYIGLVNILNTYGGSVTLLDQIIKKNAIRVKHF